MDVERVIFVCDNMRSVQKLGLKEGLSFIKQACEATVRPFFFVVGAGISNPPIKLACEMVEDFKKEARKHHRYHEPIETEAIAVYSHWFSQAYRSAVERQDYIKRQIVGKYISPPNFQLAHILLNRNVATLVVTPNFDDFLSHALHLFGEQPIVYDKPETFERIDSERDEIQIVQVHGSYAFYDSSNLKEEILEQAEGVGGQPTRIANIIENLLSRRSPLVIGYSGWEGDVIMAALRRRLSRGRLPNNVYWFCYEEKTINLLPDWLKHHPNVFFVVFSAEPRKAYDIGRTEPTRIASEKALTKDLGSTKTFRQQRPESVLSAHDVFVEFVKTFEIPIPALTRDPLRFFIDQLSKYLPRRDDKSRVGDKYSIRSVIDRLKQAKRIEEEAITKIITSKLEKVRNALRSSQYGAVIELSKDVEPTQLSNEQKNEIIAGLWSAVEKIRDNSDLELIACDLIIKIGSYLSLSSINYATKVALAKAYVGRGLVLGERGEYEESITAFDNAINRIGKAGRRELNEALVMALINKAVMLNEQGYFGGALGLYQKVIKRFGKARDLALQRGIVRAFYNKSVSLSALGRNKAIVRTYAEAIKRFSKVDDVDVAEVVASSLINKGYFHGVYGEVDKEIESYDEVVTRYGGSGDLRLERSVAKALTNKAIALLTAGKYDNAIDVSARVIRRYKDENSLSLQQSVSKAFLVQGDALSQCGSKQRAIEMYNKVVSRYNLISDPSLQQAVAFALVKKGNQYINVQQATNAFDRVIKDFGKSHDPLVREQVAIALFNKATKWAETQDYKDAISVYREMDKRYSRIPSPSMQVMVSRALVNKGSALIAMRRNLEAIRVSDSVVARFSEVDDTNVQSNVAASLFNKGVALTKVRDTIHANQVFDDLVQRFAHSADESINVHVAKAILAKSQNLHRLGQNTEALESVERMLHQFAKSKFGAVQMSLPSALLHRGFILGKLERYDDAIKTYGNLLRRYRKMTGAEFDEYIATAKNGVSFQLILQAKSDLRKGKLSVATARLRRAQEIAKTALKHTTTPRITGFIWENLGYASFLLGNKRISREALRNAFRIGAEDAFKGALEDATINTVKEDKEFIKLVRSIWASM